MCIFTPYRVYGDTTLLCFAHLKVSIPSSDQVLTQRTCAVGGEWATSLTHVVWTVSFTSGANTLPADARCFRQEILPCRSFGIIRSLGVKLLIMETIVSSNFQSLL